jgi:hypothetical protein
MGSLYITRPSLKDYTATREELVQRAGAGLGAVKAGRLRVRTEHIYPLAEARAGAPRPGGETDHGQDTTESERMR